MSWQHQYNNNISSNSSIAQRFLTTNTMNTGHSPLASPPSMSASSPPFPLPSTSNNNEDFQSNLKSSSSRLAELQSEIRALRTTQSARASVASERYKVLKTMQGSLDGNDSLIKSDSRKQNEEQLFNELGFLMQERDLLVREKSALQKLLTSASDEISHMVEAEQRQSAMMKQLNREKEIALKDNSLLHDRIMTAAKEMETLERQTKQCEFDKHHWEQQVQTLLSDKATLQQRLNDCIATSQSQERLIGKVSEERDHALLQCEELQRKLHEHERTIDRTTERMREVEAARLSEQTKNRNLETASSGASRKLATLQAQHDAHQSHLKGLEAELQRERESSAWQHQQILVLNESIHNLQSQLYASEDEVRQLKRELSATNDTFEKEKCEWSMQLKQVADERDNEALALTKSRELVRDLQKKMDETKTETDNQINTLTSEKHRLLGEIQMIRGKMEVWEQQSKSKEEVEIDRIAEADRLRMHLSASQRQLNEAQYQLQKMEAQAREHEKERNEWAEHQNFLLQQIIETQSQLLIDTTKQTPSKSR